MLPLSSPSWLAYGGLFPASDKNSASLKSKPILVHYQYSCYWKWLRFRSIDWVLIFLKESLRGFEGIRFCLFALVGKREYQEEKEENLP